MSNPRLTFTGLLRSEWRKLRTMASTWVLLGLSVALSLITTALVSSLVASIMSFSYLDGSTQKKTLDLASQTILSAPMFPGALMALLGIMSISNEYDSGMIRTTLTITPARWPALTAKAVIVAAFGFSTTCAGEFIGAALGWALSRGQMTFDLFTWGGLHAWLGSSLSVMLFALMGLATGVLMRRAVIAALTLLLGVMLVLPYVAMMVFSAAGGDSAILWYLPSFAAFFVYADPIMQSFNVGDSLNGFGLSTGSAIIAMVGWTLLPLVGAYVRFEKTD